MILEVQSGSIATTFSYENIVGNVPVNIATATIEIQDDGAAVLIPAQAMVIVANVASKSIDISALDLAQNYLAVMVIDGVRHARLFDVCLYPFFNEVEDSDLLAENEALESAQPEYKGSATAGSGTTLTDATLNQTADYWNGGEIVIYPSTEGAFQTRHFVADFAAGVVTFSPARVPDVTTESYGIRRSFETLIERAGEIVQGDLRKKGKRTALVIDHTILKNLVIYKALERYFAERTDDETETDSNNTQWKRYEKLYSDEFSTMPLVYDEDESGGVAPEEVGAPGIRLKR